MIVETKMKDLLGFTVFVRGWVRVRMDWGGEENAEVKRMMEDWPIVCWLKGEVVLY